MARQLTAPDVRARKVRSGSPPLVMVTAYDAPGARVARESVVDMILVGDSVAMVVLGHEDTLHVTTTEMAHHVAAVSRGLAQVPPDRDLPVPLVVGDLPWLSYHLGVSDTIVNAATLVRAGAQAVKLEGGRKRVGMVEAILDAEIPVMGHIGLTPQSMHAMGGFKVQGRDAAAAWALADDAKALDDAGCFAIVLEGVPDELARLITDSVEVPTIGIGAGAGCDGQVLVLHDLLGIYTGRVARFVKRYASVHDEMVGGLKAFADDVRSRRYPEPEHCYEMAPDEADRLHALLDQAGEPFTGGRSL